MAQTLAWVLLALVLAACQTAMPVEEAKRVAASFTGSAFVPPPRTIDDITAILDQQPRADPAAAARARARADEAPPSTDDELVLRGFYYRRGLAAAAIGRMRQAIDDLTKASGYAPQSRNALQERGLDDPAPRANPLQYIIFDELRFFHSRAGNQAQALEYARRAAAAVPSNIGDAILIHVWLMNELTATGDMKAAETELSTAERLYRQMLAAKEPVHNARRRVYYLRGQASMAAARGQHLERERFYREVIALQLGEAKQAGSVWVDQHRRNLAEALRAQGRLLEAENEARTALLSILGRNGRYSVHTADIIATLTNIVREQGRLQDAEKLARARIDILERIGSVPESPSVVGARLQLAHLLAQYSSRDAFAEYETVRTALAGDPPRLERVLGRDHNYAMVLLAQGRADQALDVARAAVAWRQQRFGDAHQDTAIARTILARVLVAKGDRAGAIEQYRAAILVLATAGGFEDETTTRAFAARRLDGEVARYIQLLTEIRGTPLAQGIDVTAESFRLAEMVRARGIQAALSANSARAAAKSPALAELIREEQDASKRLAAQQALLANALSVAQSEQSASLVAALRSQVESLSRATDALTAQIRREFPAYDDLVNPKPATIAQARAVLGPREAWLATYTTFDRTYVWAFSRDGDVAYAIVPIGRNELARKVEALRGGLTTSGRTLGDVPAFDVKLAHELFRALLEPVASAWKVADDLLVVPHGPLAQLPLGVLVTAPVTVGADAAGLFSSYGKVPWLARTHAITVVPSATALVTLRNLSVEKSERRPFIGFGDPWFSVEQARRAASQEAVAQLSVRNVASVSGGTLGVLPRLPDTADEIRAIAGILHADAARDVFLGDRANEDAVKKAELTRYRVIAFATHGLVPGDLDGLTQPALALSAPEVAKIAGDGLLTMEKILGLSLNADWVVLSACNTASGNGAGAEAISGLGRAFFYAGARAVLVTNWPVETTSARALTTELFQRQANEPKLSRAKALQQTMNALIDDGGYVDPATKQRVFSYAHPLFWAPFSLVGDGG
jgi:CHAT domain-containing protein